MSSVGRISKVAALAVAGSMFFAGCGSDSEEAKTANWLQENGYELTVKDYLLAAEVGDLMAIDLFREHGITVDERDVDTGDTALMRAAGTGKMEAVRHFLSEGAEVSTVNRSGRPALILAAQEGHPEVVRLLLSHGADLNAKDKDGWNALTVAAYQGRTGVIEVLAGKMPDQLDDALLVASLQGHGGVVDQLLNRGAYVNTRSSADQTPLMLAAKAGHLSVVQMLLRQGANPYALDRNEGTAANLAKRAGHAEVAEFLLHPQDLSPARVEEATEELNEIADARNAIDGAVLELPPLEGDLPLRDELVDATGEPAVVIDGEVSENPVVESVSADMTSDGVEAPVIAEGSVSVKPGVVSPGAEITPQGVEPALAVANTTASNVDKSSVATAAGSTPKPKGSSASPATVGAPTNPANSAGEAPSIASTASVQPSAATPASASASAPAPAQAQAQAPTGTAPAAANTSAAPARSPIDGMKMERYRETPLPVMLTQVEGGEAEVRMLAGATPVANAAVTPNLGEEPAPIKVRKGEMIDGTAYRVASVETKFVSSKEGKGQLVDVSQMTVENTDTGEKHLLVKDVPGRSANTYAVVTMQPGNQRYVVHERDRFSAVNSRAQSEEFQVLEIRPTQVLIENLQTRQVTTVEHDGVAMN